MLLNIKAPLLILLGLLLLAWAYLAAGGFGPMLSQPSQFEPGGPKAGLFWAFYPPPYVDLPGPVWLVLIPAALVAVACAAINVALTLGLEVVIFAARAWMRVPPPLD